MKQPKRLGKKRSGAILTLALVAVVGLASGSSLLRQHKKIVALQERQRQVAAAIDEETDKSIELENRRAYYQSDAYIEEIAREQLGLVKPGEILFINRSAQ